MKMGKLLAYGLAAFVCLYILAPGAAAQYRASIQGSVTDAQGNTVADAKVTVKSNETGVTKEATTDSSGAYSVNGLAPGLYTISVEKTGFKRNVLNDFQVIAEQVNAASVTLQIGEVTDSVTVNGDLLPLLDTESASNSGSVRADEIQKLPSIGRDPFQLLQLAPGAFGDGSQSAGGGSQNLPGTTIGATGAADGIFKTENGGQ